MQKEKRRKEIKIAKLYLLFECFPTWVKIYRNTKIGMKLNENEEKKDKNK